MRIWRQHVKLPKSKCPTKKTKQTNKKLSWTDSQAMPNHPMYSQNRRFRVWQHLRIECSECSITQHMKIYSSIHIHSCYKLTAYLNNLHFMQVWRYHLWVDLLHPRGSEGPHHSSSIVNIPHHSTRVIGPKYPFFPTTDFILMENVLANMFSKFLTYCIKTDWKKSK